MRLGLEAMEAACADFGHPERAFDAIHVAGTNGKGSTAAMLESIARRAGQRTGLATSPHLCRFAERIRVDGEPIPDSLLTQTLEDVLRRAPELSFFEAATLAAFVAFREAKVEIAIVEVGIGGRLDATNVIPPPRAAAITRIAFDHTDRLGDTLEAIAREKAGILKPGVHCVLGPLTPEVEAVIRARAREVGATVAFATPRDVMPGLAGAHQRSNACVAWDAASLAGFSDDTCRAGIERATWPGRLETVRTSDGEVLLDAAHNPDGVTALAAHLDEHLRGRKVALVFGALSDKAWPSMLDLLAPRASACVYVRPPANAGLRPAADPEVLAARHPGEVATSITDALERARAAVGPGGVLVVTGSIFLVGEARGTLLGLPRDPAVAL
ncbi:MAG: Dihydrofolate synthase [Myxococcaceae bacterium]|nr:Dihydrofolate synthase [Myxococcaceae bacterium]